MVQLVVRDRLSEVDPELRFYEGASLSDRASWDFAIRVYEILLGTFKFLPFLLLGLPLMFFGFSQ